jgi:hypothetical protein
MKVPSIIDFFVPQSERSGPTDSVRRHRHGASEDLDVARRDSLMSL